MVAVIRIAQRGAAAAFCAVGILAAFPTTGWAAPANDDFANAQTLSGDNAEAAGTTLGSTKEPGEPNHAGYPGGGSVWYGWHAERSGEVQVGCHSGVDTVVAVYQGIAVDALSEVTAEHSGGFCHYA